MIKLKNIFKKEKPLPKYKKILIPITLILIGALIIAVSFSIKQTTDQPHPQPQPEPGPGPKPQSEENPWEGCKPIDYSPDIDYNFVGSIDFVEEKPIDGILEINKDKERKTFSLGRCKLNLEPNTLLRVSKLWLSFFSDELSDREDKLYGLEDSYLSKIILKVGEKTKEINLGKTGAHAFIELPDCPLGNIYPVNYETELIFEILLEIGCNNLQEGECLDNKNKPLDYINNADLTARIRLFAISFQDLRKEIVIPLKFKYE